MDGAKGAAQLRAHAAARSSWPVAVGGLLVAAGLLLAVLVPTPPATAGPRLDVVNSGEDGDQLVGTERSDRLYGHGGADTLIGRRSKDLLSGGPGDDVLRPGKGSDTVKCGAGDDVVVAAQHFERIGANCEQVRYRRPGR